MKLVGFCGLPNSGKSTFFKLLSKIETEIANYPFTTIKPKEAVVPIISKDLEDLHKITKTKQLRPGFIKFLDVPGLIKGAHKGEGLGNEFLSYLRQCDAILEIVRTFQDENVPHPEKTIDPERDILIIEEEIIESEKNIIKNNLTKLNRATTKEEKQSKEILEEILSKLESLTPTSKNLMWGLKRFPEFKENLKEYNLLLTRDWYLAFNGPEMQTNMNEYFKKIYFLDFKWELELEENLELQIEFNAQAHKFLKEFRKDLGLIEFFTFTNDITQSWFAEKGSSVFDCAGLIHSDFQQKFIKAEIINLTDFKNVADPSIYSGQVWKLAKEKGLIKTAGKEYVVQEGDIVKILV